MALMTLAQAKAHLRLSTNYDRADLELKMEQASAIVLDYLKSRAHKRATVTSSSVASPTVITTEEAHGFLNGEHVTIAGDDSTPTLDGTHIVSNVTSTTFTIPVAVTVAGTGGTAIVPWNDETAPLPVQQASMLMLTHLYEHRGNDQKADADLWLAIERILIRSRDPAFA
jgi:hypothetical protein